MIRPTGARIVVKEMPEFGKNIGKIVLADNANLSNVKFGVVLAVGPGMRTIDGTCVPVDCEIHQVIAYRFSQTQTTHIKIGKHIDVYVIDEGDMCAVVGKMEAADEEPPAEKDPHEVVKSG